jgi:hypothetical protein
MTDIVVNGKVMTIPQGMKFIDRQITKLVTQGGNTDNPSGMVVSVAAFSLDGFDFDGGSVTLPSYGTWFIGVELSSKQVRCLPRLGHTGWVVVAKVVATSTAITKISNIRPVMPPCRIPRTMAKLRAGQQIKSLTYGSSLVAGSGPTHWAGMVLQGGQGTIDKYLLPGNPVLNNIGLGGAPCMYSFAQLGRAAVFSGSHGYDDAMFPQDLSIPLSPLGRSGLPLEYDVVVIGMLANGGDYRLETLEPILRILKKMGCEVVVLTDNAQNPSTDFNVAMNAGLYADGPALMQLAEHYGFEVADTAAYVMEAHIRANGVGIYSDTIHMAGALPNGPVGAPSSGHEAWARALRSVFPVQSVVVPASTSAYTRNFDDGSVEGLVVHGNLGSFAILGNQLVTTKTGPATDQWGTRWRLSSEVLQAGDTVRVRGNCTNSGYGTPTVGLQGGGSGWASNNNAIGSTFDVTLTANRAIPLGAVDILFFGSVDSAPSGANFSVDNLQVDINKAQSTAFSDWSLPRKIETKPLPLSRVVTDLKSPGDCTVILPHMEGKLRSLGVTRGALAAHPAGAASFARRFSPVVGAAEDLLVLTATKEAVIAGLGVVAYAIILYSENGNPEATMEVRTNGSNALFKTITIAAQTLTREIYFPVLTHAEMNNGLDDPAPRSITLRVTAGTVKIAALVAITSEHEVIPAAQIQREGTWIGPTSGGGSGMMGYATDTVNSYMKLRCPPDARKLFWLCSARPQSQPMNLRSGRNQILNQAVVGGASHVRVFGMVEASPGTDHSIECAAAVAGNVSQGYSLHVGAAVVVYDR